MIRDILLYLSDDGHEAQHVAATAALAAHYGARLTGLAVAEPLAAHAEYLPPDALDRYREAWQTRNRRLEVAFQDGVAARICAPSGGPWRTCVSTATPWMSSPCMPATRICW